MYGERLDSIGTVSLSLSSGSSLRSMTRFGAANIVAVVARTSCGAIGSSALIAGYRGLCNGDLGAGPSRIRSGALCPSLVEMGSCTGVGVLLD